MRIFQSPPPHASVSIATCTDIGRKRPKNEDACLVLCVDAQKNFEGPMAGTFNPGTRGIVLAIADGMGGHQSGEVASALCIQALIREFSRRIDEDIRVDGRGNLLAETVESANNAVYAAAGEDPEFRGMGTTLTVAWLVDGAVDVAQVGDSRAYLLRAGRLIPLTEDQTVGNLLDVDHSNPRINSQIRDMLTQAVGAQPKVSVALSYRPLEPGDLLLLCCDGLYKAVEDNDIKKLLGRPVSLQARAENLVARANENGGPDNITVILAELVTLDG
jgi:serine/threonine protein phosphatase PrpC